MEAEEFVQLWHASFGPETQPPKSCSNLGKLTVQDVGTVLRACEIRIEVLQTELKRELRGLEWLRNLVADLERRTRRKGVNAGETCRPLAAEGEDSADSSTSHHRMCDKQPAQQPEICLESVTTPTHSPTPEIVKSASSGELKLKDETRQPHVSKSESSFLIKDSSAEDFSSKCAPVLVNSGQTIDKGNTSRESVTRERFVHKTNGEDKCVARAVRKRLIEQGKWWSTNLLSLGSTTQEQTPPIYRKRCVSDPPECVRRVKNNRPVPTIKVQAVVKDFEKLVQEPAQEVTLTTTQPEVTHIQNSTESNSTVLETVNETDSPSVVPIVERVKVSSEKSVLRPVIHLSPIRRTQSHREDSEQYQFPGCKNNQVYSTHSLNRRSKKSRLSQLEEEGRVSNTLKRRSISIEAKLADRRKAGGWKVIEVSGQNRLNYKSQAQEDKINTSNRPDINTVNTTSTTKSPIKYKTVSIKEIVVKEEEKEVVQEVKRISPGMSSKTSMFKAAKEKLSRVTSSPPLRRRPSRGPRGRTVSEGVTQHHRSSNGQVESATPSVQEVMIEKRVERSESLLSEIMSHRFSNGMEGAQLLESGEHSLVGSQEGGKNIGEVIPAENTTKVILRRRSERDNDPLPEAKRRSSCLDDDDCTTPKEDFSMSLNEDNMQLGITKTIAQSASINPSRVQRLGSDATLRQESLEATLIPAGSEDGVAAGNVNFRMSYMTAVHDSPQMTYTATARDTNQVDYMPLIDEREGELPSSGRLQVVSSEPNLLDLDPTTMLEDSMELDEATISAVTLNNDMFGSRSGSVTSLPENLEDSQSTSTASLTETLTSFLSPSHTPAPVVNLRQSSGSSGGSAAARRRNRRREGNAELDDQTGASLEEMLSSDRLRSPSNSSTTSPMTGVTEEVIITMNQSPSTTPTSLFSPTHCAPHLQEGETQSPGTTRSSRLYPVRRSTVVVQGEKLVIRKLVVAGIVSAEKSYLDCLNVMKEYYRKPLLALTTTSQPILAERDINTIFYRTEDLVELHTTLHEKLETQLREWTVNTCVGDFFVELCKNLKLYKDYVEFYRQSLMCLEKIKSESLSFKTFLEDVRATVMTHYKDVPRVNELLRRPIERLQSYSLILNDLCQHTPEDHKDYSVLRQSLHAMSAFIASTHDPQSFSKLSGGYNRELVKEGLMVELSEGIRKVRRVFLFHDVVVSSKQKPTRAGVKFEPKWFLPLSELSFHPAEETPEAHRPVPATSDMDLSVMRNRIAELKAQIGKENTRDRTGAQQPEREGSFKKGRGGGIRAIYTMKSSRAEKTRKKLQEQQVSYWMAVPSLPLRLYGDTGKQQYVFLLHSEQERENWISGIKKVQPKAVQSVSFHPLELQDLLNHQIITELKKIEEVTLPVLEDEYISGMLRIRIMSASDIKAKTGGIYCAVELDEYGKFERKAKTLPVPTDPTTLGVTWDQDFELEVTGAHILKINICGKQLLKEECYAHGKIRIPIHELRSNKRHKTDITLYPQGSLQIIIEYSSTAARDRKPALLSSGVFGVPIEVVSKRERHDIPLIVETCVEEVERRGMSEIGIYRVAGVLRDVRELRDAFDTDYLKAQVIAFEADIHAVAGLLKKYFRELPDPLFTDALYLSFVQGMGLSEPEAREQALVTLLYSLPPVNFKTAVFLFKHLRRIATNSEQNKMNLNNLSTLFGPNLLRPASQEESLLNMAAVDVATPVNVLMFFLSCPEEVFDEAQMNTSPASTASTGRGRRRDSRKKLTWIEEDDGARFVRTARQGSGRNSQT